MAIETVGQEIKIITGNAETLREIEVTLPAGLQLDDVVHIAAYMPKTEFKDWGVSGREYTPPWEEARSHSPHGGWSTNVPGWTFVARERYVYQRWPTDHVLFRRIITGAEGATVTLPIYWQRGFPSQPWDDTYIILAASVIAHRGVDLNRLYAAPPARVQPGYPWNTGAVASSRLVQLRFTRGTNRDGQNSFKQGDTLPPTPDPLEGERNNLEWDVLNEMQLPAIRTVDGFEWKHNTSPPHMVAHHMILGASGTILEVEAGSYTPGIAGPGRTPIVEGLSQGPAGFMFALMDPSTTGFPVDPPVPAGQPGVTGSGWVIPEWAGRTQRILNPMLCSVWSEAQGEYGPELGLLMDHDEAPQPVALDANFNGLGACTTALAAFASDPGVTPFQHVLKFELIQPDDDDEGTIWWTGVVRNVRADGGVWLVELDGLWSLLNDARVQLDDEDMIARPEHGVIVDTLMLGGGDPTAVEIKNAADRQQTWGEYLNKTFRITPEAAWGIGPDQTFTMGLPQYGGLLDVDAEEEPSVMDVRGGEFLLPPYVTEWWAENAAGAIQSGGMIPPPGLLTPGRLVQSRLGDLGNLITPPEASLPPFTGPSHTITIAGIAVPPIRADSLPMGSQMVASAKVSITMGEEGNMPSITTTLTTVALPYERGRR